MKFNGNTNSTYLVFCNSEMTSAVGNTQVSVRPSHQVAVDVANRETGHGFQKTSW